jgi:hypothetical protein
MAASTERTEAQARAVRREARLLIVWVDGVLHQTRDGELTEEEAASRILDIAWAYRVGRAMAKARS